MLRANFLLATFLGAAVSKAAVPAGVPQYVIDNAPVVYLYKDEVYFPSDIGAQLSNTIPEYNFTVVSDTLQPLTLSNLDSLNSRTNASQIFLTSTAAATNSGPWVRGVKPDSNGVTQGAISSVTIVADKGNGLVDAFYFYFYAYNWGGILLGQNVGNHIGDWEHNAVRFSNGAPQQVYYSQHSGGKAYTWAAVQKQGSRPVAFSANGTHASYARDGVHDRALLDNPLPGFFLNDFTSSGTKWDPIASSYFYKYDVATSTFSAYDSNTPTAFLNFVGGWGDQQYPNSDPRQSDLFDLHLAYKWVSGPTGPRDKNLGRKDICQDASKKCDVYNNLVLRDDGGFVD